MTLSIFLDGVAAESLSADLLSLALDERLDSSETRLDISFDNWAAVNGVVGFAHFDDPRMRVGATLKIIDAGTVLFEGAISLLESRITESSPPILALQAQARLTEPSVAPIHVGVGAEISELISNIGTTHQITCSGASSRRLRAGETIFITGAGSFFDGPYLLKATRYTFDLATGMRTRFCGTRSSLIYKIVAEPEWRAAEAAGVFNGAAIDLQDGYIHFSTAAQARETAAKHFAGRRDLLLVAVDATRLDEALKWETSRNDDLFPHLYAPLSMSAVTRVDPLPLGADGRHDFAGLL